MIEHFYIMIIVMTYNFILMQTSFLYYFKLHLPKICFAYYDGHPSGTHLLILNLKALRNSDSFFFHRILKPTIIHKIFETITGFHVKWRTTGKVEDFSRVFV